MAKRKMVSFPTSYGKVTFLTRSKRKVTFDFANRRINEIAYEIQELGKELQELAKKEKK